MNTNEKESKQASVQSKKKKTNIKREHQESKLLGNCATKNDRSNKKVSMHEIKWSRTQASGKESKEPENNEQEKKIIMWNWDEIFDEKNFMVKWLM